MVICYNAGVKKGKLITFYGINNIGKTTQCLRLVKRLQDAGFDAVYTKYPKYDLAPSGPFLKDFLRGSVKNKQKISEEELQMWFAINRYQYQPEIEKMLAQGKIVVAEDYTGTGLAWGWLKGAKLEWLEEVNKHLIKEDLAILLEGKRFLHAKEMSHIHESDDALVEKCKKIHATLGKKYSWKVLNVEPSKEKTEEMIWKVIEKFLR